MSTTELARPEPVTELSSGSAAAFVTASNAFGWDLWERARSRDGNLALSPVSISMALAMTWGGARGETAAQMAQVLHFEADPNEVHRAAGALLFAYNDPDRDTYELRVVNRLFGEPTYTFEQDFLTFTQQRYGAPLEGLDFQNAPDESRVHINQWVAGQTNDRIRDLLPGGSITSDTRMVLTNAIYFLGDWAQPFMPTITGDRAFYPTAERTVAVPTMHQITFFEFAQTDGVKVMAMPYQGGDLAMLLILPDARDGLADVEARLSNETVTRWVGAMRSQNVVVALPKFEIDPAEPLPLRPMLAEMGMPLAFERRGADFTGIANPPDPDDRLHISEVFHKAFVKVDEEGTEAAAATAVVMARAGAAPPTDQAEFIADHPFLFLIRDMRTGLVLFVGRVVDPS